MISYSGHRAHRFAALTAILLLTLSGAALAQSAVYKSDNTQGYFDASSGVRSFIVSAADMAGGTAVNSITIAIDFEKFDGQTFGANFGGTPFYNEIEFTLTNPQNVTTSLIAPGSFNVGSNGFRGVITFDDLAAQAVNFDPNSPHAGTFKPTGSLASLFSGNGVGTWTLGISDTVGADHLGYYSAGLSLNGGRAPSNLTPEMPAGVQAFPVLLAVGGMFLYQRKKKAMQD
ncbi:MAG: hypothetical protein QM758_05170 [Armatimonas sp.]